MDREALRVVDANLNRAREALRVVEDFARFVLDAPDCSAQAKKLRHALRSIRAEAGAESLLDARDVRADVGTTLKTDSELTRHSADDVAAAAFGRLSESLRTLGEFGKLISAGVAARAEELRYAAYDLESRLLLRGSLKSRLAQVRLYVLITAALCRNDWLNTAREALRGGAGCLQLREKALPDAELLDRAQRLRQLTRSHGALFIVNDRPDIARLAEADGIHLGQEDLPVGAARRIAGGRLLIGKSTHTVAQLDAAIAEQPDYIAVGPMYASATKPQGRIAGPELLRAALGRTPLPVVAIGGITSHLLAELRTSGARCVAVCQAVTGAADVRAATDELVTAIAANNSRK